MDDTDKKVMKNKDRRIKRSEFSLSPSMFTRKDYLKVRQMYLNKGIKPSQIAEEMDCNPENLKAWVYNQGWTKIRKQRKERELIRATKEGLTEIEAVKEDQKRYYENLKDKSEELTEKAIELSEEVDNVNELSTGLASIKTAMSIYSDSSNKLGIGLDIDNSSKPDQITNLFFINPSISNEKQVNNTEVIDV